MSSKSVSSGILFKWLWRGYLRKHAKLIAVALVFMFVEGSMLGALAYMMQPMFDNVFLEGDGRMLYVIAAVVISIFLVRALSGVVQKILLSRVAMLTASEVRQDLLAKMMKQGGEFHQTHPPGHLIQRVQGDVGSVNKIWRSLLTGAGRDFIGLFVLLAVAINVDVTWALLACFGVPIIVLPAVVAQRFVRRRAREVRDLAASLATRLDEVFHGIVQIKLNNAEDYERRRYRETTQKYIKTNMRTVKGSAALPAMVDVMSGFGFMAVILYGGSEIISGEKTVGQFMSFFTAMGFAFDPMRRLASISGQIQIASASIERLKELMEMPVKLVSPENPKPAPTGTPGITLENVSLSYGETEVLDKLSLTAAAGQTTALVGASGAGKSTIFNLLTRLIDPTEGVVRVGGVATNEMALPDLRRLYSVVTQEALLFDETIRENVVMGRKNVSEEALTAALDAAHVSDFLKQMPKGVDTPVGPRGSALSGGQRQRVVIARALLRDTPILLLDEATSALDAQSESVVQKALDKLASGRTTLVIAHRLSTVRDADKIIVMDRGRVVDEGTHEELLARGGTYADLYRLQFQDGKLVADTRSISPEKKQKTVTDAPANLLQRIGGFFTN
ncbi:ABC transporter ATP-binding protein [Roseobacter sp. OBYS 0001]|uniref:ABC transporter ATP-binding protein n=1 Tax=Roseobacter sp. OBYS 0001 TaxID=882651 RepID=UPI001BC0B47E|nr:ABC transporter ATP-binding protein [Roseobacter sp. OBYS 0001]GIT86893.1 ABC transporter ATP-binding protein [Roseobacter sp. OBYS 0001]